MTHTLHRIVVTLPALLLLAVAPLSLATAADPPAAWGPEKDGLSCRVVMARRDFCQDEVIPAVIEVRNRGTEPRTILAPAGKNWWPAELVQVVKDHPRDLQLVNNHPAGALRAEVYTTIAPGQTLRHEVQSIVGGQRQLTAQAGRYTVSYRYTSARPADAIAQGLKDLWTGTLESAPLAFEVREPSEDDLTVHEWGVFTVYPDLKYANADLKEEWESMPPFFYRQFPKLRLLQPIQSVRKPIVYFHTKTNGLHVQMNVRFTDGAPVVWWPCCSAPIQPGPREQPQTYRELQWNVWLGSHPPNGEGGGPLGRPPQLPAASWLNKARIAGPALVSTFGSPLTYRGGLEAQRLNESEHFIYYDGLMPAPDYLRCPAVEPSLKLKNVAAFALPELFIVDRRQTARDGKVRWSHLAQLTAGEQVNVTTAEVAVKDWPRSASAAVEQALVRTGLTTAEAQSILAIWQERFFQTDGITVFHLLPQAEYDRRLPLEVSPRPGRTVRVGIVLYPRLDLVPVVAQRVGRLIAQLDAASFQARDQATRELIAMGPHAFPHLRQALATRPPLEVRMRIERVLEEAHDATSYLPPR